MLLIEKESVRLHIKLRENDSLFTSRYEKVSLNLDILTWETANIRYVLIPQNTFFIHYLYSYLILTYAQK